MAEIAVIGFGETLVQNNNPLDVRPRQFSLPTDKRHVCVPPSFARHTKASLANSISAIAWKLESSLQAIRIGSVVTSLMDLLTVLCESLNEKRHLYRPPHYTWAPAPSRHATLKRYTGRILDRVVGRVWWLLTLLGAGSAVIGLFNFVVGLGAWGWWARSGYNFTRGENGAV
ncbi:hypothetical protein R3P38DRAFT_3272467 [Favolaschia claudopus]|uniref:Uncharacterized protein n=1 Tax=Favolaschia claudopus TaxID=2862362 RepID=A0AAW0B4K0_9AGAR